MTNSDLLAEMTSKLDEIEKFQGFIARAREQAEKFKPEVVEKVVSDNTGRVRDLSVEVSSLREQADAVVATLNEKATSVQAGAMESQFALDELELRRTIGDLDDDAFQASSEPYRTAVESAEAEVKALHEEAASFQSALARWASVGGGDASAPISDPSNDTTPIPADPVEPIDSFDLLGDDTSDLLSSDLESSDVDASEEPASDEPSAELMIDLPQDDEHDDLDLDGLDFSDDAVVAEAEELPSASDETPEDKQPVLLYLEGTPEEQIYTLGAEEMSLGRGRDNDVQVRNDSKVSRYHCKLYKRGPNYYIEDNKSANGTLVNGELITERRLFGGEEVIIGETFFRFRLVD